MKCSESERRIYVYEELTADERRETDQHLATCLSCRQIMERAMMTRQLIVTQRDGMQAMPDAARMTRRIMDAVRGMEKKKTTRWSTFFDALIPPLRYGMAGLSLFLVITFIAEYSNDSQGSRLFKRHAEMSKKAELNLASFHSAFLSARQNDQPATTALFECVTNCSRSENSDCADCLRRFSQP